eukprot:633617_1
MEDLFAGVGNETTEPQPSGDAVVVNQTASDDFAFMTEDNPYDHVAPTDEKNDNVDQPQSVAIDNDDPLASMVPAQNDANDVLLLGGAEEPIDLKQDELGGSEQKEKSEDEPTFLSVWQEERKLELEKRRDTEKESQKKSVATAQTELEKFEGDRAKRIENKKKENREKEKDLRDDLDAVFKHGTIWEQVGKMVNLNEKMIGLQSKFDKDRFRDLLIHLRNAKQ